MKLKGLDRTKKPIEIEIENGIITKVKKLDSSNNIKNYIIPGFIDIHTHGGYGTDFADNDSESIRKYLRNLPKEGTTSIVQATITTEYDNLISSLKKANEVYNNPKEDEIRYLGVNIEGNFLNKKKKGAHKEDLLVPLEKKHIDDISETKVVKMISAAYENSGNEIVDYVVSKNIIPSLAHTCATGKQLREFIKHGLKGATHTFNAYEPFTHRDDNALTTVMNNDNIYAELIVDGIHVHPQVVKLLYKIKPLEKILLITDSSPSKGMPDGEYKFGEIMVIKKGDTIISKVDGALAASIANMHMCFKNIMKFTNCSLEEASIMTSTNQAKYLGINDLGDIKEGYKADILVLNENYDILKTISKGRVLYNKGE